MAACQLHAVVGGGCASPPQISRSRSPNISTAPQPPGPGIPAAGAVGVDHHLGRHATDPRTGPRPARCTASLRSYSSGSLGRTRAPAGVAPQSASRVRKNRSAAPWARIGRARALRGRRAGGGARSRRRRRGRGDVEAAVGLEAPGVQRDADVVGERVPGGEIEVDRRREAAVTEEHVVGEVVGVDDPFGQARPARRRGEDRRQIALDRGASPGFSASAARRGPNRPPRRGVRGRWRAGREAFGAACAARPDPRRPRGSGRLGAAHREPGQEGDEGRRLAAQTPCRSRPAVGDRRGAGIAACASHCISPGRTAGPRPAPAAHRWSGCSRPTGLQQEVGVLHPLGDALERERRAEVESRRGRPPARCR
jgi:hypothetical protein